MKNIFARIRAALDRFVRAHIVDDEENLWPNRTPEERAEEERNLKFRDAASR